MILEGIFTGAAAGAVVCAFRMSISRLETAMSGLRSLAKGSPGMFAVYVLAVFLLFLLTSWLLTHEKDISGSGVPQL